MPVRFRRAFLIALAVCAAGACSSLRPYARSGPDNLIVNTDVRSGAVRMHVHEVDGACKMNYLGTVEFSESTTRVGLPAGRPLYLVFDFHSGSALTGYSSTSYEVPLTVRAGYSYMAEVAYIDRMYSATVYERDPRSGVRRRIPRAVSACASTQANPS